ncbi:putative quinol monooxygenase [Nocardia bovistercoris]|uniref:Antibiotic biosynthesis monooxygenase n=1 Tax=Nocardia bovistercoris TaxID=2785916 RepID=A0A931IH59_9NOCA|nr:antibiotic biosynthesis monooxygenase [Nocardia bovistercoris]MBH0779650.1 antibiotic biosynthesis monooxygenase [Nocardia bovistercoris]
MYALVVKLTLHDTDAAVVFDRLASNAVARIAENEPGTLLYAVHTVDGEPRSRMIYEVYADREAFEYHQRQSHTRYFLEQRDNYVESSRVEFLTPKVFEGFPKAATREL